MAGTIRRLEQNLIKEKLHFESKPILIGGMAMEYYGIRRSGADIDLVITDKDYQTLAASNPDKCKDLWGDLGVVIGPFEIWRSIARMDYSFYLKDAVDEGAAYVVSLERLMFMRVIAMGVEKYRDDLQLMIDYYYKNFTNQSFVDNMEQHMASYERNNGVIFGGKYLD